MRHLSLLIIQCRIFYSVCFDTFQDIQSLSSYMFFNSFYLTCDEHSGEFLQGHLVMWVAKTYVILFTVQTYYKKRILQVSLVAVGTLLTKLMLDFLVNAKHAFYIDHFSTPFFLFYIGWDEDRSEFHDVHFWTNTLRKTVFLSSQPRVN